MEETIANLKAGLKKKRVRTKEAIEKANDIAASGKTRCSCGARKRASADKCTRCKFIEQHSNTVDVGWASRICLKCRNHDALVDDDGIRRVLCDHCYSINKRSIKKRTERRIMNKVCVNCGGKYGPLATNRLCEHCRSKVEQAKLATPRIKKIINFSSAINKLCDDILEIDKFHELATQIKKLVESMTVKK